jgi:hypothetical protein
MSFKEIGQSNENIKLPKPLFVPLGWLVREMQKQGCNQYIEIHRDFKDIGQRKKILFSTTVFTP